jgi:2-keto-3-deoxy-galactonokinase
MLDPEPSDEMVVTLAAYGLFMVNWSLLETIIEVAIMKRLELNPLEGNIVTSSLSFQARSSILRSLLELDESKEAREAKTLIGTIVKEANRNAIIHGQVFVAGSHHLRFIYRKTDDSLSAKCIEVDCDSMQKRATSLRQNIVRLQVCIDVAS